MRRMGAAFVAVFTIALGLAGCAQTIPTLPAFDITTVACKDITAQLDVQRAVVKTSQEKATAQAGTPGEAIAKSEVTRAEEVVKALEAKATSEECTQVPGNDGQAGVEDADGELKTLPVVGDENEEAPADTTLDARTPASLPNAPDTEGCEIARNWADLVACVGDRQWYKDGVDARKGKTGFGWGDVIQWANDTAGYDTRAIIVFGMSDLSDADARDRVRELIGDSADQLPVVHHGTKFANTRGFGREVMADFIDARRMVRVSLMPVAYDTEGGVRGLSAAMSSGVFVDCDNLWWIPRQVVIGGPPPAATETETPPETTPPSPTQGKGTANPESQHGFWGNVDPSEGERVAPPGPSVTNSSGTTRTVAPANPTTKPGASHPSASAPSRPAPSGASSTAPVSPNGGVGSSSEESGTTAGSGTPPETGNAGSNNGEVGPPPD